MYHPELEFEFVTMKTSGDMILDRSLDEVAVRVFLLKSLIGTFAAVDRFSCSQPKGYAYADS
jgi:hypothetical protein